MEKRIQVWFKTMDWEYENKICAFLQYHYAHRMEVHHYSDWIDGNISPSPEAVLLTDGDGLEGFYTIIPLTEDELTEKDEGISMYQSGHRIAEKIIATVDRLRYLSYEEESFPMNKEEKPPGIGCAARWERYEEYKHHIWSVYSPTGGVGKTTFAISLALVLANTFHMKVLYLNLENVSSYMRYFDRTEFTLSDLLYALLMNRGDDFWDETLDRVVVEHPNGLYSIAPCERYDDVLGLSREEVEKLTDKLLFHFDYVVCDFDTSFWGPAEKFMGLSQKNFLLWDGYLISDERRVTFDRMIDATPRLDELFKKTKVSVGRGNEECYTEFLLPEDPCPIYISSKDGKFYPEDKETPYRNAVEKIVRAVLDEE